MPPKDNFFVKILLVFGTIASAFAVIALAAYYGKNATSAPVSYQAQNLESLKIVRPNDLILCVVDKPATLQPEIKFAFLVEQNKGKYMTGYYPSQYTLSRADGGESFSLLSEWKCEMRILRPSETRAATDMLASIILYGLNQR